MNDSPPTWPDIPRLAFDEAGGRHSANLAWVLGRKEDLEGYVSGYRIAAEQVFEATLERNVSPERMLFPLAFLWRHHLELSLKDVIAKGRALEGQEWGYPSGHDLIKLWSEARLVIVACSHPDAPELPVVEANLVEFERIDPSAAGFRYPHDRSGGPNLRDPPHSVDLEALQEAMLALAAFFDAVRMELSVRLSL